MKYILFLLSACLTIGCCSFSENAEASLAQVVRDAGYYYPKLKTTMTDVGGVFEIRQNEERLGDGEVIYAFPYQEGWLPNKLVTVQEVPAVIPNISRQSNFDVSGGADFGRFTKFPFKFNAAFKGTQKVVLEISKVRQRDIALSTLQQWFNENPKKYNEVKGKFIVVSTLAAYQLHYQFLDSGGNAIGFTNSELIKAMGLDVNLDAKWSHTDEFTLTYTADENEGKPIVIGYKAAMVVPTDSNAKVTKDSSPGFNIIDYDGGSISALMD